MPQRHPEQHGTFHITTNTRERSTWCTLPGVPEILIDNLRMTARLHEAEIIAFCILPDHVHFIVRPGEKGLSAFMHSFKRNCAKDVRYFLVGEYEHVRSRGESMVSRVEPATAAAMHSRSGDNRIAATVGTDNHIEFTGWQKGYHDELIRDDRQLQAAYTYVTENPIKHNLVEEIAEWPWTSLHYEEHEPTVTRV